MMMNRCTMLGDWPLDTLPLGPLMDMVVVFSTSLADREGERQHIGIIHSLMDRGTYSQRWDFSATT